MDYHTTHFPETTVRQLADRYTTILLDMCRSLDRTVLSLSMMTAGDQAAVARSRGAETDIRPTGAVHRFFEQQARLRPGETAVTDGVDSLDYAEVDRRADRLALRLRQAGAGHDRTVGVLVERGLHLPVAVLAILKTGAAYLPLDPGYPEDRLIYMLEKVDATLLVATKSLAEHPCTVSREVIWVDANPASTEEESRPAPDGPWGRAYVMFTSGSTGRPKAVGMPHSALVNLVSWQTAHSRCRAGHRTLQFAALSFDVSFQEMFSTWAEGGTLVMPGEDTRRDLVELLRFIEEQRVDRIFLPFVVLEEIANAAEVVSIYPTALREVVTAGEQLRITPAVRTFFERLPNCRLVNQYGPTEAHVVSSYELEADVEQWEMLPPIGRSIDNTRLFVLDRHLQPVSPGVAGELYIAGQCLAEGYVNDPQLTSERFIVASADLEKTCRLYRTGDICSLRQDGNIDYLGRADRQIKIRGFRIELGEVENVIRRQPGVKDVVVDARRRGKSARRLAAYLVVDSAAGSPGCDAIVASVRNAVIRKLPEYMVPHAFVPVTSFPKTPVGKLDWSALPEPDGGGDGRAEPSTATQLALSRLWCDILDVERPNVRDSFFDLGGDSLSAAVLFMRIRSTFGKELPLSTLYEHKTIEELGAAIDAVASGARANALVPMRSGGAKPPLYLVHGAWGSVMHLRYLVERLGDDQPCYGLSAPDVEGGGRICNGGGTRGSVRRRACRPLSPGSVEPWRVLHGRCDRPGDGQAVGVTGSRGHPSRVDRDLCTWGRAERGDYQRWERAPTTEPGERDRASQLLPAAVGVARGHGRP